MSAKNVKFTIRLNAETNHEATVKAKDMNITRAEIIRLALDSYLTQTGSNPNPELEKVDYLNLKLPTEPDPTQLLCS